MRLISAARARSVLQAALILPLLGSLTYSQSVIATIPASDGTEGNPMTIAVNPLTSRVYIAGSNVEVVNEKTNQVIGTISVGSGQLQGIAVDPTLNRAYVIDNADGLFAIDLNTNTVVGNYGFSSNVNGIAVNPFTHRVYVQAPDPATGQAGMFVFEGASLKLLATIDDSGTYQPFGNPQDQVVVNPVTNMIYTAVNLFPGAVWVIDGKTNTSVTTITGLADLAYGVDVDPARNLVWVSGQFGQVSEVNGATNTLISNSNPNTYINGISVDPVRQRVYAISTGGDEVQIINEKTNTVEATTIPVGGAPVNSAIDYVHGLLYVGNTGETYQPGAPPPSVSAIKLQ
ncbi:MAG TPA: YncE family protein [Terracidiphilus sp.]|nr:YncE family protein [Terracidiphilus sp.]